MKSMYVAAASVCLFGCGGDGLTTGPVLVPAAPVASSGFAKPGDDIANVPTGTTFTIPAQTFVHDPAQPFNYSVGKGEVTVRILSATQIEVTRDGAVDILDLDTAATGTIYEKFGTDKIVTAYIYGLNPYASKGEIEYLSDAGPNTSFLYLDEAVGVFGYATDPAVLSGSATYSGTADLFVLYRSQAFDVADGTASLTADFASSTLTGSLDFADPLGDGNGGPVDLGTFSLAVDGVISGNAFAAPVNLDPAIIGAVQAPQRTLDGAFFGPTGEYASGVAIGAATSATPGANNDMNWELTVNTQKQ